VGTIEKTFQKGDVIIKEGHFSNSFYVILEGSVEVIKRKRDQEIQLAVLKQHEFFGEMSLLDPDRTMHSASVRALEPAKVMIMDKEDFDRYIGNLTPGMRNLLAKLVIRLRETSKKVTSQEEAAAGSAPAQPDQQESAQAAEQAPSEEEKPLPVDDSGEDTEAESAPEQPAQQESAQAAEQAPSEEEKPLPVDDSGEDAAAESAPAQPDQQESAQEAEQASSEEEPRAPEKTEGE